MLEDASAHSTVGSHTARYYNLNVHLALLFRPRTCAHTELQSQHVRQLRLVTSLLTLGLKKLREKGEETKDEFRAISSDPAPRIQPHDLIKLCGLVGGAFAKACGGITYSIRQTTSE